MIYQSKDSFYDIFLKEPTKEHFREFLEKNGGEMDEYDFKEEWIDKGHLAKTILAMANSHGGCILFGIKEDDGKIIPVGLEKFKDKADINNDISRIVSPNLDYEVFDFSYDTSEYDAVIGKKFQILVIHDTPERLPFISLSDAKNIEKDNIYVRRGTKCVKASAEDIDRIIEAKINTISRETTEMTLEEHLHQLKVLYNEMPEKIKVLIRKGQPSIMSKWAEIITSAVVGTKDEFKEVDNPNYPDESYEQFIARTIKLKKIRIEHVLEIK